MTRTLLVDADLLAYVASEEERTQAVLEAGVRMTDSRYLLRSTDPEKIIFAFRAAQALEGSDRQDTIYAYRTDSGETVAEVWTYRTKTGSIGARVI